MFMLPYVAGMLSVILIVCVGVCIDVRIYVQSGNVLDRIQDTSSGQLMFFAIYMSIVLQGGTCGLVETCRIDNPNRL